MKKKIFSYSSLILMIVIMLSSSASYGMPITISDTVEQEGGIPLFIPAFGSRVITKPFYDFTSSNYLHLTSIDYIKFSLRINDGDSQPGGTHHNNLFFMLDGINTGIVLNGFPNNNVGDLWFEGAPSNSNAILTALQTDGTLIGAVYNSAAVNTNIMTFGNNCFTNLEITGRVPGEIVPDAGAWVLTLVGLSTGAGILRLRSAIKK